MQTDSLASDFGGFQNRVGIRVHRKCHGLNRGKRRPLSPKQLQGDQLRAMVEVICRRLLIGPSCAWASQWRRRIHRNSIPCNTNSSSLD